MSAQLLKIHPLELKFTFEVKKQSSCAIHLANVSDQHVVFKVKTTSPKKYCVRPNIGIIKPKATCDFTVTRCGYIDPTVLKRLFLESPSHFKVAEDVKSSTHMGEPRPAKVVEDKELSSAMDVEFGPFKDVEPRPVKDVEGTELKLAKEIEALKSKLKVVDSKLKLIEAEFTISKLKEENSSAIFQEKGTMKQKLAVLRRNSGVREVQVGFPFLYVCMVALISLTVGYLVHP